MLRIFDKKGTNSYALIWSREKVLGLRARPWSFRDLCFCPPRPAADRLRTRGPHRPVSRFRGGGEKRGRQPPAGPYLEPPGLAWGHRPKAPLAFPGLGLFADSRSGATVAPREAAAGPGDTTGISFLSCPRGAGGPDTLLPGM